MLNPTVFFVRYISTQVGTYIKSCEQIDIVFAMGWDYRLISAGLNASSDKKLNIKKLGDNSIQKFKMVSIKKRRVWSLTRFFI